MRPASLVTSLLRLELIASFTYVARGVREVHQIQESQIQEGQVQESQATRPCVARNCGKNLPNFGDDWSDVWLCTLAGRSSKCNTAAWAVAINESTHIQCPSEATAADPLHLAFDNDACHDEDLCQEAAAHVALFTAVCGLSESPDGRARSRLEAWRADDAKCKIPLTKADKMMRIGLCEGHHMRVAAGGIKTTQLLRALSCPCQSLKPPGSRSAALLQRTMDRLFILKRLDEDHAHLLFEIEMKLPKGEREVLTEHVYFDYSQRMVAMKNAFNPASWPLRAEILFRDGAGQQCREDQTLAIEFKHGWDVKPPPCKSKERPELLAFLVRRRFRLADWKNFAAVTEALSRSLAYLDGEKLVDFSLLLSVFDVQRPLGEVAVDPACQGTALIQEPTYKCMQAPGCSVTGAQDCQVICLSVIDYLMRYGFTRWLESTFKGNKWEKYHTKTRTLWSCLGDLTAKGCEDYLQMGCDHLRRRAAPTEDRAWCRAMSDRPTITGVPAKAYSVNGCKPDGKWQDDENNDCIDYEGMTVTEGDFQRTGARGRTPAEACCVVREGMSLQYVSMDDWEE